MRQFLIFLLGSVVTFACTSKSASAPQKLIVDSIMVKLIADGFILQSAFSETFSLKKDSISQVYSDQLFSHYQISRDQLDETMEWYYRHPTELDTLYMDALLLLEDMQNEIEMRPQSVQD